ncbi:hypothetical protein DITRI_Ditri18aG0062800 [Diplodiscus trichospermus]
MKSCDKVWKLALFAIIWTVWMTRNDLVFNNRQADLEQTIDLSKLRLAHWVKAKWPQIHMSWLDMIRFPNLIQIPAKKSSIRNAISWSCPDKGVLKFNVDGSVIENPGLAEIGYIIDHFGVKKMTFSKSIGIGVSSLAELLAIREAFILFSSSPWANDHAIIIESDCANVVK